MTFTTPTTLPEFDSQFVIQRDGQISHPMMSLSTFQKNSKQGLILYFYPKDNTAGCTTQAQDFSEHLAEFHALGFNVVGVSRDSVASHERFVHNKSLTIPLISDKDEQLCEYFGSIGEKMLYGKMVRGVIRSTLVFDKAGILQRAYRNVRAKGHVQKLLVDLGDTGC